MKKLKKILISIELFLIGLTSKVFGARLVDQAKLAQTKYGIPDTIENDIEEEHPIGFTRLVHLVLGYTFPIVIFVIGLIVIFNKKLSKRTKVIIIAILACVLALGKFVMGIIFPNIKGSFE